MGASPMMTRAEMNANNMRKLLRRGIAIGDSAADTTLIKAINTIHSKKNRYYVLFKDDSTRASIEIRKLNSGYEVIMYWKSMGQKEIKYYNPHYLLAGTYSEYYENGLFKVQGTYLNGKQDGKWKYYNSKGDETSTDQYSQGTLMPNSRLR